MKTQTITRLAFYFKLREIIMIERDDKLSALMDSELHDSDKLLQKLTHDDEMRAVWQRYHLARDAIKTQLSEMPLLDISARVSETLQKEATIITPLWRRISPRYVAKQVAGLAVAAAVGTVAIISVQQAQLTQTDNATIAKANIEQTTGQPVQQFAQNTNKIRQVSFTTRQKLDADVESKLSGYLVNHNEFSNALRVSAVMPYTRIVSFVPAGAAQQVENDK
jgi:sigma-E factor negative regulatory protein RseA